MGEQFNVQKTKRNFTQHQNMALKSICAFIIARPVSLETGSIGISHMHICMR